MSFSAMTRIFFADETGVFSILLPVPVDELFNSTIGSNGGNISLSSTYFLLTGCSSLFGGATTFTFVFVGGATILSLAEN